MARFNYFFNFLNKDVEAIRKDIIKYGFMDWVSISSGASMQMAVTDNGFCIKAEHLDDLQYRIEEDNTILRFNFEAEDTIAEWKIPATFSSVTIERYC